MAGARHSRSIRFRSQRKRIHSAFDLQLTSMLDVLVIILVFLLKSYSAGSNSFNVVPGVELPISSSIEATPDSLNLVITPEAITFENQRIVDFEKGPEALAENTSDGIRFRIGDLDENGLRVLPLFDALVKAREKAELLRTQSKARDTLGNPLPFEGVLAIQADKKVHYAILQKVMYTAAAAGYPVFRLLAIRRGS